MEAAIGIEPMNKGFAVSKVSFVKFCKEWMSKFLLAFRAILHQFSVLGFSLFGWVVTQ
jgi:hypothetical protein